jgi:hypothetical protein
MPTCTCACRCSAVAAAAAAAAAMATGERGSGARKFEATPDFVAGGPLHPYQLEGLNWLYHKAQVRCCGGIVLQAYACPAGMVLVSP